MPWELNGNAGTTQNDFLGTSDAHPLFIKTNGAEAVRIDIGGNVAIGVPAGLARRPNRTCSPATATSSTSSPARTCQRRC